MTVILRCEHCNSTEFIHGTCEYCGRAVDPYNTYPRLVSGNSSGVIGCAPNPKGSFRNKLLWLLEEGKVKPPKPMLMLPPPSEKSAPKPPARCVSHGWLFD